MKLDGNAIAEAEQIIDFLSGGETEKAVFVFSDVPSAAVVELQVFSFSQT